MCSIYQENKPKHLSPFICCNKFFISLLSAANCFVVTTRNQNFTSQHGGRDMTESELVARRTRGSRTTAGEPVGSGEFDCETRVHVCVRGGWSEHQ